MSEILWAVIIGGAIGVIGSAVTSIPSLIYNHYHWKKDFKLQYLIAERKRREEQCDRIREQLNKGLEGDLYPVELAVKMFIRLPKKESNLILKAYEDTDHSNDEEKRKLYQAISTILGNYLGKIDKQIEELTQ